MKTVMTLKTVIEKCIIYLFLFVIVAAGIFNYLGFILISNSIILTLKIGYFLLLALSILCLYKNSKCISSSVIIVIIPFLLLFSGIPFKVLSIVVILPLLFSKEMRSIRDAGIVIYSIFIVIGLIGIYINSTLGDFVVRNTICQKYSPDKSYLATVIDSDQGALGGDTYIDLYRIYYGIVKKEEKALYHGTWGENPNIQWIDNVTVKINDRTMNIKNYKTWDYKEEFRSNLDRENQFYKNKTP